MVKVRNPLKQFIDNSPFLTLCILLSSGFGIGWTAHSLYSELLKSHSEDNNISNWIAKEQECRQSLLNSTKAYYNCESVLNSARRSHL